MAEEIRDAEWYAKNRGLATGGIDITTLTNANISIEEIEGFFGPRISKNGFRYDRKPEPEVVAVILEIYRRVTGKDKVLNNQINLCFARAAVAWLKGGVLDWEKYAVHCNKYAIDLRQTKSMNCELKEQGLVPEQPIPLRKRAPRPPIGAKRSILGASDVKVAERAINMPSRLIPKANLLGGPEWKEGEVFEVKDLLETLNTVLLSARQDVLVAQEQNSSDIVASQVCKMHLEGRQKVTHNSESHRLDIVRDMNDLLTNQGLQGEIPGLTPAIQQHLATSMDFSPFQAFSMSDFTSNTHLLPQELQDIQQKLEWAVNNEKVVVSMLNSCHKDCEEASKKAKRSLATLNTKKSRVQELGVQILCVDQQLQKMREGGGLSFYPQPLIYNPDYVSSSWNVINISNCPMCGHGFELNDILVGSCGHTYHPICMRWHTNSSLYCKLASCGKPFHEDWLLSVGVRPSSQNAEATNHQIRREKWMHKLQERCLQKHNLETQSVEQQLEELQDGLENLILDTSDYEWNEYSRGQPLLSVDSMIDGVSMNGGQSEASCQSSFGSKLVSPAQEISPEGNSGTQSSNNPAVTSEQSATKRCSICYISSPDLKLHGCGHFKLCYNCVVLKPPKVCPVCFVEVNGWSRTTTTEVTSPLRDLQQSKGARCDNIALLKPPATMKLNLSSAFDAKIVPHIEALQNKKLVSVSKPKPLQMEIYGQKETILKDDSSESDAEDFLNQRLIHFPPRPIIHRAAKQHSTGAPSSGESEPDSEGEGNDDKNRQDSFIGNFPDCSTKPVVKLVDNIAMAEKDEEMKSTINVMMDKEELEPKTRPMTLQQRDSELVKRRKNPLDPNPGCERKITRAEVVEVGAKKVLKARKRKKSSKVHMNNPDYLVVLYMKSFILESFKITLLLKRFLSILSK